MKIRTTLIVGVLSALAGCDSDDESSELAAIPFTEIAKGDNNLVTDSPKRLTVVRNLEQFEVEWPRISSDPLPSIDFQDTNIVIAEKGFQAFTGIGDILITLVLDGETSTEVQVTTFFPGPNCAVDAALSSPFHVVAISNERSVIFRESEQIVECN